MGSEKTRVRGRARQKEKLRPSQVVRPNAALPGSQEVRTEGEHVLVAVFCPDVDAEGFRYAIGRRHVLIWSADQPRTTRHFVLLPRPVDKKGHNAAFRNGVFDLKVRVA